MARVAFLGYLERLERFSMTLSSRATLVSLVLLTFVGGGVYGLASCGGSSDNGSGDDGGDAGDATMMMDGPAQTCDANLQNDPHHCGSCTTSCSAGQFCSDGGCKNQCTAPEVSCSGVMGCIDLSKDLDHCGDCNRKCVAPQGGIPVPDGGVADAGGDAGDDGGPVDDGQRIATAQCNAGKCDFTCPQAPNVQKCVNDASPSGCFDITISAANCGGCGNQCSGACQQGICCDTPSEVCNGVCVDVTMDPNNCGGCGKLCNISGESCGLNDGGAPQCHCPAGQGPCNGSCIDVTKDPNNCGMCGHACHNGQQCLNGGCGGYSVTSPSPQAFVDACTLGGETTVLQSLTFGATPVLTLPFTLQYWGTPTTQYWINVEGALGFDANPDAFGYPGESGTCPNAIPDGFTTDVAASVFGDFNLSTGANGICYAIQGNQPNRQLVVTWKDAMDSNDTNSDMIFSAIVTETSNTIDFVYKQMNGTGTGDSQGATAIVGLQSPLALAGVTKWCQQTFANTVPQSVRFTPIP